MQLPPRTLELAFVFRLFVTGCLTLSFVLSPVANSRQPQRTQGPAAPPEALWYWFADCHPGRTMGLEILLSGRRIYRSSFPMCRLRPVDVQRGPDSPTLTFSFKSQHPFQGSYRAGRNQTIEGNIWQAGAEPDGVLLGISFSTKQEVLLNTIHFARPDRAMETKLDRGVVIRTNPMLGSRPFGASRRE